VIQAHTRSLLSRRAKRKETDSLADLASRHQKGDPSAFARLIASTQQRVYNLAYQILGHRQEAEDLTQEVYLRVWRALSSFRGEAKLSTWLYRITVNACLNRRRKLREELYRADDSSLEQIAAHETDPMKAIMAAEEKVALWSAVNQLPAKYRVVITLFYQEQQSYKEIARVLSVPVSTVKARLNRARRLLASCLEEKRSSHETH